MVACLVLKLARIYLASTRVHNNMEQIGIKHYTTMQRENREVIDTGGGARNC